MLTRKLKEKIVTREREGRRDGMGYNFKCVEDVRPPPLLCQMLALWDKVGGRIGQCCTCPTVEATQVVVQCGVMETHQFKPTPCP